jgi:hypothetical protein
MKSFGKVAGINLAVVLAYSALVRLAAGASGGGGGSSNERGLSIMIFSAFAVGAHLLVCLGVMIGFFVSGNREKGRVWLATAGVVLVVGFSVCLGNGALS